MKESTRIILIIICALLSLLLIGVLVCGIVFRENFYEGFESIQQPLIREKFHKNNTEKLHDSEYEYNKDKEKVRV